MGFFTSEQETKRSWDRTVTTYNSYLDAYTAAPRTFAPWTFAAMDPRAYLASAATVSASELETNKLYEPVFMQQMRQEATFQEAESLAGNEALERLRKRQASGEFLTPQELVFVNQMNDYDRTVGNQDLRKYAETLAGSRGMRMSDTPISQQALREQSNFELGLSKQRSANILNLSAQQNTTDLNIASFVKGLTQQRQAIQLGNLFGGGMQGVSNIGQTTNDKGTETGSQENTPSGFDQMTKSFGFATGAVGSLGAGYAAGGGNLSSIFGQPTTPSVGAMKPGFN